MNRLRWVLVCALASFGTADVAAGETRTAAKLISAAERAFRDKDYDKATNLYSEALSLEPAARTYYARHKALMAAQKMSGALADLEQAIAREPNFALAYLQKADLELLTGKCAEAVNDYQTVLKLDPSKRDAQSRLPHAHACAASLERAEHARSVGNWHAVRDALNDAIMPDRAGSSTTLFLQRAEAHAAIGEIENGLADAAKVLKLEPANVAAFYLRGRLLYAHADYATARAHYQAALKVDPEHKGCKDGYRLVKNILKARETGDAAVNEGRWDDAIAAFEGGAAIDPSLRVWQMEVLPKLARTFLRKGQHKDAARVARQALSLDDNCAECHYVVGMAALEVEEWEEASRETRRAHELDRGNGDFRDGAQRAEAALKQSKTKDYYKVLGIPRNADKKVITKAYRQLAREHHPDAHQGDAKEAAEKMFQSIAEAYEILSDDEKRGKYDRGEDVSGQGGGQGHPGQGFPFPGGFPFGGGGPGGGGFTFQFRAG